MGLDTNTDVEEIDGVKDRNGDTRPPANADEQAAQTAALQASGASHGNGAGFDKNGSAYPYTIDPTDTIQVFMLTEAGDIVATVTTSDGNTFDLPIAGSVGVWDDWEIDSIEFKDPNNTGARVAGSWAGA